MMATAITDHAAVDHYAAPHTAASLESVPVAYLTPSPFNPRKQFDPEGLAELAASLTAHGMLEPIVVRERPDVGMGHPGCLEILAGERRYRASLLAGLPTVPVRALLNVDDRAALEICVIENLQRRDLDPLEQAAGFAALAAAGMTQTAIAAAVHVTQPTIAKSLGLLKLPEDVQELIRSDQLSASHGETLEKFAAFPAVVSAVAAAAVKGRVSSRALRAKPLLEPWGLAGNGLIQNLNQARFDTATCAACPFGAKYDEDYLHFCLRPEHFAELNAATDAERKRETNAAIQEIKRGGGTVPKLSRMAPSAYQDLRWRAAPPGCDGACPCRGQALDHEGAIVAICTDPIRFHKLAEADAKAAKKDKRSEIRGRLADLGAGLQALDVIDSRELAVIVHAAFQYASIGPVLADAVGVHLPEMLDPKRKPDLSDLASLAPLDLVRFAVHALIGGELHRSMGNDWTSTTTSTWYWEQTYRVPAGEPAPGPLRPCVRCGALMEYTPEDIADPASAVCAECGS